MSEETPELGTQSPDSEGMSPVSRRSLIKKSAAVGAGAASVLVLGSASVANATTQELPQKTAQDTADIGDSVADQAVLHVRDARAGAIDIFHGERHTRIQDRELARAIQRHLN